MATLNKRITELSKYSLLSFLGAIRECRYVYEEELDFLASYVYVLKERYGNQLEVVVEGKAGNNTSLIPFTLQLLIENVTKHNVITSQNQMRVTIELQQNQIIVCNPIHPRKPEPSGRIGLQYLTKLYARHGCQFRIENSGSNFTVFIPLLKRNNNDEIRYNRE